LTSHLTGSWSRRIAAAALAFATLCGLSPWTPKAEAALTLCNESSYMLEAAVAHPSGSKWKVEGWWSVQPGACVTALKEPLKKSDYYTFARSIPGHEGGTKAWGGRFAFCTGEDTFSLTNRPNCQQAGLKVLGFSKIETDGADEWTSTFTETAGFSANKARIAGIQRLLGDIGYDRVNIDGFMGRRTRLAITKFKKENKLKPDDFLTTELFDGLARAANAKVRAAGLELCNETEQDLFAAVAEPVKTQEAWASRGWYHLTKGSCLRVIKDPLEKQFYYVYAEANVPAGELHVWGGKKEFCTNNIRFSIDSDQNCALRGYDHTGFVEINTDKKVQWKHTFTGSNRTNPPPAQVVEVEAEDLGETVQ